MEPRSRPDRWCKSDARLYQIAALTGLLVYGMAVLQFDILPAQVFVSLSSVLVVQLACSRLASRPFEWQSALISGLSLCLLLRSNHLGYIAAGGAIAISSKFFLRWRGKHLFNPTNFALVVLLLVVPEHAWVSGGQWGSFAFFGFLMVCVGGLVATRAKRADVALTFLGTYFALLFGRSLWLNEPLAIPLHRMQSGALLLFTFFMISDPKTTPDSRTGRIIFGAVVALGAAFVHFKLFRTNGLLWGLAACSMLVPLLDRWLPATRFSWKPLLPHPRAFSPQPIQRMETDYEPIPS